MRLCDYQHPAPTKAKYTVFIVHSKTSKMFTNKDVCNTHVGRALDEAFEKENYSVEVVKADR